MPGLGATTDAIVDDDGNIVHPLLAASPALSLWRAPTDNDRIGGMAAAWAAFGLDRLDRRLVSLDPRRPDRDHRRRGDDGTTAIGSGISEPSTPWPTRRST